MIQSQRIKQIKSIVFDLSFRLGIHPEIASNKKGSRILIYHGIDKAGRKDINTRFISQYEFEQQIRFFKKHFTIVPLSDFVAGNFPTDKFTIALTFDDGYWNNLEYALPILEKYQVHATFFVTAINTLPYPMLWADYLDISTLLYQHPIPIDGISYTPKSSLFRRYTNYYAQDGKLLKQILKSGNEALKSEVYKGFAFDVERYEALKEYWKPLSDEEIRLLDNSPYASVESHGFFHNNLDKITYFDACKALSNAKYYLENILQRPVNSIAYPDGGYTEKIVDFATKIGFTQQFATNFRYQKDAGKPELFERMGINPFIHYKHQAHAIIKGRY